MINMVTYNFKRSGLKRTRNILNNISVEDVENVDICWEKIYGIPTLVTIRTKTEKHNFSFTDNEFGSIRHLIPKL